MVLFIFAIFLRLHLILNTLVCN